VRAIVQGPRTEQGVQISNGFPIAGLSPEWDTWITGPNGLQGKMSTEFYRWMVFHDGSWSLDRFNLDHDWKVGKARLAAQINADNPDLRAFVRRGGKLILYQGWADAAMSPENTINFYEAVRKRLGPAAADHARLFMAPGMNHCIRGDGPNVFDAVSTLDKWVEGGPAPEQIIATKYENDLAVLLGSTSKVKRTRPLCAWPTLAQWDGRGSSDDAASFTCVQPK
jgi:feruloyl esterase